MRLRYLIWSNPMILQREPRIGTALSIYTESYFLPLFQGPSFWPEPALGGSHVPLLMSPVAWECPCVRTSVRNLLTPTSTLNHSVTPTLTPHSPTYTYFTATTSQPCSTQLPTHLFRYLCTWYTASPLTPSPHS